LFSSAVDEEKVERVDTVEGTEAASAGVRHDELVDENDESAGSVIPVESISRRRRVPLPRRLQLPSVLLQRLHPITLLSTVHRHESVRKRDWNSNNWENFTVIFRQMGDIVKRERVRGKWAMN
jgi:hypothetical protein